MKVLIGLLVFISVSNIQAQVSVGGKNLSPGEIACSESSSGGGICHYHSRNHKISEVLIEEVKYAVNPAGFIDNTSGFIRPGADILTIDFWHNDPKILQAMKDYLVLQDQATAVANREEVYIKVNYYVLSQVKAKEKGFSLNFTSDAMIDAGVPRATGSPTTGIGINIGNLSNQLLSMNLNFASENGLILSNESQEYPTYDGFELSFSEDQVLYSESNIDVKEETATKRVSGRIVIDEEDPSKVYIYDFGFRYPIELEQNNSLIETKRLDIPLVLLSSGMPKLVVNEEISVKSFSKKKGLLSYSNESENSSVRFVTTITAYTRGDFSKKNETITNEMKLPKFTQEDTRLMPEGSRSSFKEALASENVMVDVLKMAMGPLSQKVLFQINPKVLTQNIKGAHIRVSVIGDAIKFQKNLLLEHISAGPLVIDQFDIAKLSEKTRKGEKIKFKVLLSVDEDYASTKTHKGFQPYAAEYSFLYIPEIASIELVDSKIGKKSKRRR